MRSEFSKAYERTQGLVGNQMSLRDPKDIIAVVDVFPARPDTEATRPLCGQL